jgi:hypothetical protein
MLGVTEHSQVWLYRQLGGEKTSYRVQVPAAATNTIDGHGVRQNNVTRKSHRKQ